MTPTDSIITVFVSFVLIAVQIALAGGLLWCAGIMWMYLTPEKSRAWKVA